METESEIQSVLQEDGILLTFPTFEIYGIRSTGTSLLRQEPAFAEVERLNFEFMISTSDQEENNIASDNTFTIEDNTFLYSFIVIDVTPFTDGWSRLLADYTSRDLA